MLTGVGGFKAMLTFIGNKYQGQDQKKYQFLYEITRKPSEKRVCPNSTSVSNSSNTHQKTAFDGNICYFS